ncbi:uncharacterized protein LOC128215968 [Mya arenaria]|uniref:uncharacterized protein LOC128215968 n=1 Tax=Mya arenaria TaxID=6604 RepID=UPI0022E54DC4|nr:uncharacterized protein LOC128215968 [Mya arenaria]
MSLVMTTSKMILDFLKFFAQLFGLLSYQSTEPTTPNIYCTTTGLTPFFQHQDINSDVVLLINDDICFTGIDNGDWIKVSEEVYALKPSLVWKGDEANFNPEEAEYTHVVCAESYQQQCMNYRDTFDYFWTRNQTDASRSIHKRQFGNLGSTALWSSWSKWSECSGICNKVGVRTKERKCELLNKVPSTACSGTSEASETCNSDCQNSTWTSWERWSYCPEPCNGTTTRLRNCKTDNCTGSDFEQKSCTQDLCSAFLIKTSQKGDRLEKSFSVTPK